MFATMEAARGVRLAATRVGVDAAVFVYIAPTPTRFTTGYDLQPVVVPEGAQRNLESTDEAASHCPVATNRWHVGQGDVFRCRPLGNPVTVEGTGLLARCLQHETDHLSTVFGDRLSDGCATKLYAQHGTGPPVSSDGRSARRRPPPTNRAANRPRTAQTRRLRAAQHSAIPQRLPAIPQRLPAAAQRRSGRF